MECSHDECTCMVEGSTYCSGYCEDEVQDHTGGHTCDCAHADCVGTTATA